MGYGFEQTRGRLIMFVLMDSIIFIHIQITEYSKAFGGAVKSDAVCK